MKGNQCPPTPYDDVIEEGGNFPESFFPPEGSRVSVTRLFHTREPGDDEEKEIIVQAGTLGVVIGYVVEWNDVHVQLDDGQEVWVCPCCLEVKPYAPPARPKGTSVLSCGCGIPWKEEHGRSMRETGVQTSVQNCPEHGIVTITEIR